MGGGARATRTSVTNNERVRNVAERSVLAYFARREEAERACSRLREAGYDTVQLDEISQYGGESTQRLQNPLTGRIDSLADLSAGADTDGGDTGPLIAADVTASGFAGRDPIAAGMPAYNWLVTVVTDADAVDRAVQIVESEGGFV